jgi:prepilin signal peptidase PulO-like enzyme (type II secretory pathway)
MQPLPVLPIDMLVVVFVFVFGLIVGSFLNVVVLRTEKHERLTGRSYCPTCKKKLVWYELVPVFSWLVQRGTCRGCHRPISIQYPLVEFLTGVVFVLVFVTHGGSVPVLNTVQITALASYVLASVLWALLIVIAVYDFRTKLVPDRSSYGFAVLAFALALLHAPTWETVGSHVFAAAALFLPFYVLWKVSNGAWMGLGDGKLAIGIGLLLGPVAGLSAVLFAFWIGAVVSLTIIAAQRLVLNSPALSKTRAGHTLGMKSEIPFAPYLILGVALVYFFDVTLYTFI